MFPEGTVVDVNVKANLQNDVMLCFPCAALVKEESTEIEEMGQRAKDNGPDQDGWTTVTPKWRRKAEKIWV
ncbi:hypothetical protein C1H46_005803 [Malus baccata]|uniref:Uncharacterized protein n=1 Tax=Malus baccata TaxID=106549 RepID=A0A540NC54_MALBA|nr:hypothetical protein C1H46_005803 [Malus baccata]